MADLLCIWEVFLYFRLQIATMDNLPLIIVAGLLSLALLFAVIFFAVQMATKSLRENIGFLAELKELELQKQGYGADVQKIVLSKQALKQLQQQRRDGYITKAQFDEKKKQLLAQ